MRLLRTRMTLRPAIFACTLAWLGLGYTQEPHRVIPSNAHDSADEQGWSCNRGFTQVAGRCLEDSDISSSASAFEIFDGQWRCRAGYHRAGKYCVPGIAPEHAAYVGEGIIGSVTGAFRKPARNVRRSNRRRTDTSRHPDMTGCATPASLECRIIAPRRRTQRQRAKPKRRLLEEGRPTPRLHRQRGPVERPMGSRER